MEIMLLALLAALLLFLLICQIILMRRPPAPAVDLAPVQARLDALDRALERTERCVREEIGRNRDESAAQGRALRDESMAQSRALREEITVLVNSLSEGVREQIAQMRLETASAAESARTETANLLRASRDSLVTNMADMGKSQTTQLAAMEQSTGLRLEAVRVTVDQRLKELQQDNAARLEQMRRTVDEQLQGTLEKRLGESFRIVSDRLEQVHKGLGEMQSLASGVGDLKKVLTNVRARGAWGEVQLGALLQEVLSPDQFAANVATTGGTERVEFAIRLPGAETDSTVWLPIDAKFPHEDYLRLLDASERGDAVEVECCAKQIEQRILSCARDIRQKYVAPPLTTDFAVMYLPTESLYAEVLRRPGLVETLQRDYRVTVAGPTTLAAFLNSLRMGFRTLAIQQRSSEVWQILAAVKTEFGRYSLTLDKLKKKLEQAADTVDQGLTRTRVIERKLRDVETLPVEEALDLIDPAEPYELHEAALAARE